MLMVSIALLLGIWRYRTPEYFRHVGLMAVWMLFVGFIGGSNGPVAQLLVQSLGDGPAVALYAVAFIFAYWGGIIYFVQKLRYDASEAKLALAAEMETDEWSARPDDTDRKVMETVAVIVGSVLWAYFFIVTPILHRNGMVLTHPWDKPAAVTQAAPTAAATPTLEVPSVEDNLRESSEEINRQLPKKVGGMVLLSTTVSGRTFTYNYQTDAHVTAKDIRAFVIANVLRSVCKNASLRSDMKMFAVTYRYSYFAKGMHDAVGVNIDNSACIRNDQ